MTYGDGVWGRTFVVPNGYQASYAFFYMSGKENLTGQHCADPDNNYRTTPLVTGNTAISETFGKCPPTLAPTAIPTAAPTAPTLTPTFTPTATPTSPISAATTEPPTPAPTTASPTLPPTPA